MNNVMVRSQQSVAFSGEARQPVKYKSIRPGRTETLRMSLQPDESGYGKHF